MKNPEAKKRFSLNSKIPVYMVIIVSFILFTIINGLYSRFKSVEAVPVAASAKHISSLRIIRDNDYKFVRPILFANVKDEDKKYNPLKDKVKGLIESSAKSGSIVAASVYFESLNDGTHFSINPGYEFMFKPDKSVGKLFSLLKQGEKNPGIMDKQVTFNCSSKISTSGLKTNQSYTVRDLVFRYLSEDDECVIDLLNPMIDADVYKSVFSAIQEPAPDAGFTNRKMNVYHYAKYLKLLYNSGYLNISNSEFVLQMMTNNSYQNGLTRNIDKNVKVSHYISKNYSNTDSQVSEFGIVFLKDKPYLLSVITNGTNSDNLTSVIATVSKIIYEEMNKSL